MPGPIRSEADAFRWVVWIGAGALTIIVLALLASPTVGAIWGLLLVLGALALGLRGWQRSRNDVRRRVLLVSAGPLDPAAVSAELAEEWGAEPTEVLVVSPAADGGAPAAVERARQEMELSLQAVREAGARALGRIAESDQRRAYAEAVSTFDPAEVIVGELPGGSPVDLPADEATRNDLPVRRLPLAGPRLR